MAHCIPGFPGYTYVAYTVVVHNSYKRSVVSTLLQLWAAGSKPFLSHDETRESTFLGNLFLESFQGLAAFNVHAGKLLYHFKPKLHMLGHLLDFVASTNENPESFSNWVDEDNMKWLAKIAASLKPQTATQQLSKQYILKRTLAWSRNDG